MAEARPLKSMAVADFHLLLRAVHRTSAIVIGVFALVHLSNHLAALADIATHVALMETLRSVYRNAFIEPILLASVTVQVLTGSWLVLRGWKQRQGKVAWLQALSGAYLAVFLLIHVAAVLFGRSSLHLDTNFYYAAAGFFVPPYQYFFAPYYFLAVLALFAHLGCAAYWQLQAASPRARTLGLVLPIAAGGAIALLIVLSLAGALRQVDMPQQYKDTYAH